jgi:hypothetical protein
MLLGNRVSKASIAGDQDGAIADYTEAVRRDPGLAEAYAGRAVAWAAKGDRDKAAADRRQAEVLKRKP